jgi:hypothetical protein
MSKFIDLLSAITTLYVYIGWFDKVSFLNPILIIIPLLGLGIYSYSKIYNNSTINEITKYDKWFFFIILLIAFPTAFLLGFSYPNMLRSFPLIFLLSFITGLIYINSRLPQKALFNLLATIFCLFLIIFRINYSGIDLFNIGINDMNKTACILEVTNKTNSTIGYSHYTESTKLIVLSRGEIFLYTIFNKNNHYFYYPGFGKDVRNNYMPGNFIITDSIYTRAYIIADLGEPKSETYCDVDTSILFYEETALQDYISVYNL